MRISTFDFQFLHPTPLIHQMTELGLDRLGHDCQFLDLAQNSISNCRPDTDLVITVGDINPREFENFKNKNPRTKIVYFLAEYGEHLNDFKGLVDVLATTQSRNPPFFLRCKEEGFPLVSVPLAADDRTFYKTNSEKCYDINFIGTFAHGGNRSADKYLYPLLDKFNCFVGGFNQFIPYNEINGIRNKSKITINFHVPWQKDVRVDGNQTMFSANLSSFQICDHFLAKEIYNGSVVVPDEGEWIDKIEYYLNHKEEREELETAAREQTLVSELWTHRMEKFLTDIYGY